MFKVAEGSETNYASQTVPVRHKGVWYLLGVIGDTKVILALEEANKEIRPVGGIEDPLDIFQEFLKGRFNFNNTQS